MFSPTDHTSFVLFLKLKNQSLQGAPGDKKYSMIKEIRLHDGVNLIGSDICKCSVYLPFDEVPAVLGSLRVLDSHSIKQFFLTDFGSSPDFALAKARGKPLPANVETAVRVHQKVYIGRLAEMHVQMLIQGEADSMCFEEDEGDQVWGFQEEPHTPPATPGDANPSNDHSAAQHAPGEQTGGDKLSPPTRENGTGPAQPAPRGPPADSLRKRNGDHLQPEAALPPTLKQMAEDSAILAQVQNPFGAKPKLKTPKKRAAKKVSSDEKTNLKILNYFKPLPKADADFQATALKSGRDSAGPQEPRLPQKKLFADKPQQAERAPAPGTEADTKPDPSKYSKPAGFLNIGADSCMENNLGILRRSLARSTCQARDPTLSDRKLESRVQGLLRKADVIQTDPAADSRGLVRELKALAELQWWVCFSNVSHTKGHAQTRAAIAELPNVRVFDDFEEFIEADCGARVQKALVMASFKRTYKLVVAMNKNVLPLDYRWARDAAEHRNVFSSPGEFILDFPLTRKTLAAYDRTCRVGWFRLHAHKFRVDLRHAYLRRKRAGVGFLQNHNVIIYDKCFRGLRLENLNISRAGDGARTKPRGERSAQGESDRCYIMRRMVETADGRACIVDALAKVAGAYRPDMVNVLVVESLAHKELRGIHEACRFIKIFAKESFLNAFLKQYLHPNEQMKFRKQAKPAK